MKLSDKEYNLIKDIIPGEGNNTRGAKAKDNRLFIDGIIYVLKNGIGWRQLPKEFGNWNSIWRRFNRWSESGVWNKVFEKIRPELKEEVVSIDSTSIKVHQEATRYIKKTQKKSS